MKINPPTPGQLIDTAYLANIATAINEVDSDYAKSKGQSKVITNRNSGVGQVVDTMGLAIEAGYVSKLVDVKNKGDAFDVSYTFTNKFKYAPIVTATPQIRTTGTNKDVSGVSASIQAVTASSVSIKLVFDSKSAKTNIGVNIIAVGIPSAI
jgi:hypothetical protein